MSDTNNPRTCTKCLISQPIENFALEHNKYNNSWRRRQCNTCRAKYSQRLRYKITETQQQQLLSNAQCAICHAIHNLNIDHCHKTGKVRGILCFPCNVTLGRLKENITTLRNMISYLEEHES